MISHGYWWLTSRKWIVAKYNKAALILYFSTQGNEVKIWKAIRFLFHDDSFTRGQPPLSVTGAAYSFICIKYICLYWYHNWKTCFLIVDKFADFQACIQEQVSDQVLFIGCVDNSKQWTKFIQDYLIRLSSSGIPRSTGQQCRILYKKPNTESAEQTFVWLGKFKKILNSMNKKKHMFFLYCLVRERNIYTEWCYANGLKPKLPQAMKDKLMVSPTE